MGRGVKGAWKTRAVAAARWLIRPREDQPPFQRPVELGVAFFTVAGLQRFQTDLNNPGLSLPTQAVLCAMVLAQVLLIVECIRPRRLLRPALALSVTGLMLSLVTQFPQPTELIWRVDAWLVSFLIYLTLFRPRSVELPLLIMVAVAGTVVATFHPTFEWAPQLLTWSFTLATPLILILGTRVVEAMVDDHLANKGTRRQSTEADQAVRARTEALSRLRREMHDLLLHCLQLIASPWSTMSPSEARSLCSSTVEQLPRIPRKNIGRAPNPSAPTFARCSPTSPANSPGRATANGCPCFPPRPSARLPGNQCAM